MLQRELDPFEVLGCSLLPLTLRSGTFSFLGLKRSFFVPCSHQLHSSSSLQTPRELPGPPHNVVPHKHTHPCCMFSVSVHFHWIITHCLTSAFLWGYRPCALPSSLLPRECITTTQCFVFCLDYRLGFLASEGSLRVPVQSLL